MLNEGNKGAKRVKIEEHQNPKGQDTKSLTIYANLLGEVYYCNEMLFKYKKNGEHTTTSTILNNGKILKRSFDYDAYGRKIGAPKDAIPTTPFSSRTNSSPAMA
jgi:hypothetical protein